VALRISMICCKMQITSIASAAPVQAKQKQTQTQTYTKMKMKLLRAEEMGGERGDEVRGTRG